LAIASLIFILAFASGCVLAFTRHPIYGLMTYVADVYLQPPSRWWGAAIPGNLRWSLIAAAVTALAVIVYKKSDRKTSFFGHSVAAGLVLYILWLGIETFWAMDKTAHQELLGLVAKYALLVALIYKCVDSEKHLRYFCWTHVAGCFYLGWVAYTAYEGGRFEDFGGGAGITEANSGALQIVTGILVAGSLFLEGRTKEKLVLLAMIPFIVNALIVTVSRGGFLSMVVAGVVFNYFTPVRLRLPVRVLSVLALILFVMLTNPLYWSRIQSLQAAGAEVEGVDTGAGRLVLVEAQWRMFRGHPFGCGHRCTATLSPSYLDDSMLTGEGETRARSSHNTIMTMLVEQGIPGGAFYLLLLWWVASKLRVLARELRNKDGLLATMFPAVAAIVAAILVGDLFVDYLLFEARFWFVAITMVMLDLVARTGEISALQGASGPIQTAVKS
jgi:O-antigen ligase